MRYESNKPIKSKLTLSSINQSTERFTMKVYAWLIDLNPPSGKLPHRGWFPGGSKKWPNSAGQCSIRTLHGLSPKYLNFRNKIFNLKNPSRNFVLCSILKWSSNDCLFIFEHIYADWVDIYEIYIHDFCVARGEVCGNLCCLESFQNQN